MRVEQIRRLIKLVEESKINELEVRRWWTRVRILKQSPNHPNENGQTVVLASAPSAPAPAPSPTTPIEAPTKPAAAERPTEAKSAQQLMEEEGLVAVNSPMVGTFYRAPSPGAPPYVEVNQHVEVGQVVCIVEAMKLMNEIESEIAGTIARVMIENGQPVEFNQPLFLVKPD